MGYLVLVLHYLYIETRLRNFGYHVSISNPVISFSLAAMHLTPLWWTQTLIWHFHQEQHSSPITYDICTVKFSSCKRWLGIHHSCKTISCHIHSVQPQALTPGSLLQTSIYLNPSMDMSSHATKKCLMKAPIYSLNFNSFTIALWNGYIISSHTLLWM